MSRLPDDAKARGSGAAAAASASLERKGSRGFRGGIGGGVLAALILRGAAAFADKEKEEEEEEEGGEEDKPEGTKVRGIRGERKRKLTAPHAIAAFSSPFAFASTEDFSRLSRINSGKNNI